MSRRPGSLVGTPGYMAPEQLNGERGDARADVFAYGVLIYELACGAHPFASSTPVGVAARILHSDAAPIDDLCPALPAPLAAVVDRCLRKSPAERFGSAAEIAAALAGSGPRPGSCRRRLVADASGDRHRASIFWRRCSRG